MTSSSLLAASSLGHVPSSSPPSFPPFAPFPLRNHGLFFIRLLQQASRSSPDTGAPANPPAITYHPNFPKTSTADVILLSSSSHVALATSKIGLQATSSVFASSLLVGTDERSEHFDDLPVIKLEERAAHLSWFLSFIQVSPVVDPEPLRRLADVDGLLSICDKYDAPLIGRAIALRYLPSFLDAIDTEEEGEEEGGDDTESLVDILAVSLIHFQFATQAIVTRTIRLMGLQGAINKKANIGSAVHTREGVKIGENATGWRPWGVGDIALSFLKRMSSEDVAEYDRVRTRVMTKKGYNWKRASLDFKIHAEP